MNDKKNSVLTDYVIMVKFPVTARTHPQVMKKSFGTTPAGASSF